MAVAITNLIYTGDGDITRVLRVEGTLSPDYPDVARFLGIQFAKSKRFRHSDLMLLNDLFDKVSDSFSANDAFLDATNSGPSCPQRCTDSDSILCDSGEIQAEDCLTLDIYVPQHFLPKSNPPPVNNVGTAVFVFLHGGAFRTGSIRGVYQGDYLSSQTGINALLLRTLNRESSILRKGESATCVLRIAGGRRNSSMALLPKFVACV
eukprot:GHVT01065533.1.p1 GENE.GHVT01065533.1~~GHVT01065533.1.p1  ORF type:complete len:207 (-),score=3.06 GHVT01065533.1:285-905(-)